MAKKAENIFVPTDLHGQILQSTDETGLTADNVDIFEASDGTFYREIGSKTIHTTIAKIRAMSGPNENIIYKTMDYGIPGEWMVDSSDTTTTDDTGSCLVTADGVRLKRKWGSVVNVLAFGAVPDGKALTNAEDPTPRPSHGVGTDNGPMIQAAIAYSNSIGRMWRTSTGRLQFTCPVIYFPKGIYVIKTPIDNLGGCVKFQGDNCIWKADENWDDDDWLFSVDTSNSYATTILSARDITIDGFAKVFNFYNNNTGDGEVYFNNVRFFKAQTSAIDLSCRSTVVKFDYCRFNESKVNVVTCNKVSFDNCTFDPPVTDTTNNYVITITNDDPVLEGSACELSLTNCFLVPSKSNPDFVNSAWVRNMAEGNIITFDKCRVGGEGSGGYPLVLNESGNDSSWGHNTGIFIYATEVSAGTRALDSNSAAVILKDVPNNITIRDCSGFYFSRAIRWHPDISDPDSIVSAITNDVAINIDAYSIVSNSEWTGGKNEYVRTMIPDNLRKFTHRDFSNGFTGTEIDFSFAKNNYYQSISTDTTYTVSNIIDGKELNILFTNSDSSAHTITITGATFGDGTSAFIVPASSSVMVKLISINSVLIGWVNIAPSATLTRPTKHISADYTVTNDDEIILVDTVTAGADINITLPTSPVEGQVVRIVNFYGTGSGHNAVVKDGSTTIISLPFEAFAQWVYHDSNWRGMDQGTLS